MKDQAMNESNALKFPASRAIDVAIILGLIALILVWCFQILRPCIHLIMWGAIIAIAVYPAFSKLETLLGGRRKLALTIIVGIAFALIVIPAWLFTTSFIESGLALREQVQAGSLSIPPPSDSVRAWPVIGERAYATWSDAAAGLSAFLAEHRDQVKTIVQTLLGNLASTGLSALQFMISVLIGAAFLANTKGATQMTRELLTRIARQHGEPLRALAVATIRSVAVGVLGIAIIQGVAAGIGIAVVGLPAAGFWALIVLMLAIVQLPPLLVLLPLAIYVFSIESTTVAVIFLVWCLVVSFSDAVLKPLLLGRGVDAPMLAILLGAIGGMILSGIIGLFVGAVVLSLSYKLFRLWIGTADLPSGDNDEVTAGTR
jgi:predicted PurR-regulated permease PerM